MYVNDLRPDVDVQMYADDIMMFNHARSKEHVAVKLQWARCLIGWTILTLNRNKIICVHFTGRTNSLINPDILVNSSKVIWTANLFFPTGIFKFFFFFFSIRPAASQPGRRLVWQHSINSLYKQIHIDKKPRDHRHCNFTQKYNFLN